MGDENPIHTLVDYSKPSHEGYRNTIELLVRNNVVPLRSDTIRLVQNECSFYGLWSEDPNQHLKDFLKLVDSLDLDGENRERTRLSTSWRISIRSMDSGPYDTQYCMEDPEQAFVEYASSRTNEAGGPSDMVKNPKVSTSPVFSARSYPIIDPQCSSHPSTSINAIKAHSKEANISQASLLRPRMEIKT
ncbi:hypothetical protein Tco_0815132 [Tanacetum coccineum]